jgi:hypothetical protein
MMGAHPLEIPARTLKLYFMTESDIIRWFGVATGLVGSVVVAPAGARLLIQAFINRCRVTWCRIISAAARLARSPRTAAAGAVKGPPPAAAAGADMNVARNADSQPAQIDATGLPLIGLGILMTGVPDGLAKIPIIGAIFIGFAIGAMLNAIPAIWSMFREFWSMLKTIF